MSLAPNLKQTTDENKALESELREIQLKQDAGQSIGPDFRDLCKREHEAFQRCISDKKKNAFLDCKDYIENVKNCEQYWKEVQDYRVKQMDKSGLEFARDQEYDKCKAKMHDWYIKKNLTPPEDI